VQYEYVHIIIHLTAYLLWNAKPNVILNFSKLITKFIRWVGDLKQRRLENLHIFPQTSILFLKCEVCNLWYLVIFEV